MNRWFGLIIVAGLISISGLAVEKAHAGGKIIGILQSFPACDDAKVLRKILHRFNWAERRTWHRGIELTSVDSIRERPPFVGDDYRVPRRFCRGRAHLTNGRSPRVHFLIEQGGGFAGTGFNVEFCVDGLDPWRVYDGSCRVLRR
ncbi:MAG: hypothetical protein AAF468_18595 [Pseudomonadota bacterium]